MNFGSWDNYNINKYFRTVSKYFGMVSYKNFVVVVAISDGFRITQFPAAIAPIIGSIHS